MIEKVLQRLGSASDAAIARLDEVERHPALTPRHTIQPGRLSGVSEAFAPATVERVWELLADPLRMPVWDPTIGEVVIEEMQTEFHIGDSWTAHARTQRADGKPIRVKPEFQAQNIELVARTGETLIEWRVTCPDAARANAKRIRVELEPAAGGTQLRISLVWERSTTRPVVRSSGCSSARSCASGSGCSCRN